MQAIGKINHRFNQIGYRPKFGNLAFNDLSRALMPDETILNVVEGSIKSTVGVVIATDLRVFYVGVDKRINPALQQISYDDISEVKVNNGLFVSVELTIKTKSGNELIIKGCDQDRAQEMIELINLLVKEKN
ncbi:MAG: PH domain-containing protein [Cytophagaceae bacterium]